MFTEGKAGQTQEDMVLFLIPAKDTCFSSCSLIPLPQLLRLENLPVSSAADKHCFAKRAGAFLGDTQTPKANALFLCSIWGSTKQLPKLDNEVQMEGTARRPQKGHF